MAPSFVVVEFLGENSVAVVPTKWTEDDGKNTFCCWPRPNPTHSRIRKAEIPDKQFWERLPIRVFRKTLTEDFDKALQYEKQAEMFSSPEEVLTKRSHITPERYRNDEEDVFDADASTRPLQPVPANTRPLQGIQADLTAQREAALPGSVQTGMHPAQASTRPLKPVPDHSASTSQYQAAPRSSRNALDSELFQLNMKVQNILENQGEIMRMLRGLAAQSVGPESVDVQDLIDQPFETLE
ncbi:uncharacterized protein LOC133655875 [Entelurus aequoreus]|uniref:uncharacterized protein LOC133655875 n=1 Tax=Entelurus aequoreus TaxID=161455 RepID=UPI002B1D6994|nr:uncharacterized protein LOC133655875 [Entelurus aequoreus]